MQAVCKILEIFFHARMQGFKIQELFLDLGFSEFENFKLKFQSYELQLVKLKNISELLENII